MILLIYWLITKFIVIFNIFCIDLLFDSQVYCNILAGACFAMGLKFAGSGNQQAYKCLVSLSQMSLLYFPHVGLFYP